MTSDAIRHDKNNNDTNNKDDTVSDPNRHNVREWIQTTGLVRSQKKQLRREEDPLMGFSLQALEAFVQTTTTTTGATTDANHFNPHKQQQQETSEAPSLPILSASLIGSNNDDDVAEESPFLDPDLYISTNRYVSRNDGSLATTTATGMTEDAMMWTMPEGTATSLGEPTTIRDPKYWHVLSQYLDSPTPALSFTAPAAANLVCNTGRNSDISLDDENTLLWNAISQFGRNATHNATMAEELHRQVFANEAGFLENSPDFLAALTDTTKVKAAEAKRRGESYRLRQEIALVKLQKQMDEFGEVLRDQELQRQEHMRQTTTLKNNSTNNGTDESAQTRYCVQCRTRLSAEEIRANVQQKPAATRLGATAYNSNPTATGATICRVCYKDVLVAESKRRERTERDQRESRSRALLRSFHETGTISHSVPQRSQPTSKRVYKTSPESVRRTSYPTTTVRSTAMASMDDGNWQQPSDDVRHSQDASDRRPLPPTKSAATTLPHIEATETVRDDGNRMQPVPNDDSRDDSHDFNAQPSSRDPFEDLTVVKLKELLKAQGLKVSGRKSELQQRLRQHRPSNDQAQQ